MDAAHQCRIGALIRDRKLSGSFCRSMRGVTGFENMNGNILWQPVGQTFYSGCQRSARLANVRAGQCVDQCVDQRRYAGPLQFSRNRRLSTSRAPQAQTLVSRVNGMWRLIWFLHETVLHVPWILERVKKRCGHAGRKFSRLSLRHFAKRCNESCGATASG